MSNAPSKVRVDSGTLFGLLLGVGGIVGGLLLEGGILQDIFAPTAFLIVLGGTMGAVMITTPRRLLRRGIGALGKVFFEKSESPEEMIDLIVAYSTKARRHGILALETSALKTPDWFLRKALNLAVDGVDLQDLRHTMELEIEIEERTAESDAKVFEDAGGYAPTIGIIGAVLGLTQVMKDLSNLDRLGHGITIAFVSTIYGVAFANLFFLPAAGKIKARALEKVQMRELMLQGVMGIVQGLNPKLIRNKLEAYAHPPEPEEHAVDAVKITAKAAEA